MVTLISKRIYLARQKDFVINSGGIKLFLKQLKSRFQNFLVFIIMGVPDRSLGEKVIIIFEKFYLQIMTRP